LFSSFSDFERTDSYLNFRRMRRLSSL
jgi:hypothetical protein